MEMTNRQRTENSHIRFVDNFFVFAEEEGQASSTNALEEILAAIETVAECGAKPTTTVSELLSMVQSAMKAVRNL